VLISSPLSPSQKECETNPSREEKKASVFSNRIRWRKSQSFHSQKLPRWTQQHHERKKSLLLMPWKSLICRPEIIPKYFDKLKPEPGPIRKARPDLQLYTMPKVSF